MQDLWMRYALFKLKTKGGIPVLNESDFYTGF